MAGSDDRHTLSDPLYGLPLIALDGGTSLHLLAHVPFRWRNTHTVNPHRTIVALLLLALIPVEAPLPALGTPGLLAAILVGLIAFEAIRSAAARDAVRHYDEIAVSGHEPSGNERSGHEPLGYEPLGHQPSGHGSSDEMRWP